MVHPHQYIRMSPSQLLQCQWKPQVEHELLPHQVEGAANPPLPLGSEQGGFVESQGFHDHCRNKATTLVMLVETLWGTRRYQWRPSGDLELLCLPMRCQWMKSRELRFLPTLGNNEAVATTSPAQVE